MGEGVIVGGGMKGVGKGGGGHFLILFDCQRGEEFEQWWSWAKS